MKKIDKRTVKKDYLERADLRERETRKSIWMGYATRHFDTPKIRKEASRMFDEANPL